VYGSVSVSVYVVCKHIENMHACMHLCIHTCGHTYACPYLSPRRNSHILAGVGVGVQVKKDEYKNAIEFQVMKKLNMLQTSKRGVYVCLCVNAKLCFCVQCTHTTTYMHAYIFLRMYKYIHYMHAHPHKCTHILH
jgi:hypothetical protein